MFQFHSPSFQWDRDRVRIILTIENLEKSRKQALIDKADAEQRRLDNELKNYSDRRYSVETWRVCFTQALASQIIDNIFGEDGDKQNDGRTTIG